MRTYLEEAELVGTLVGTDYKSFDIANISVPEGNRQSW